MFRYFPAMFLSVRTFLALFFHLCVGALGGRGGGEGVLVKGREGNAGKDGSEGKEKEAFSLKCPSLPFLRFIACGCFATSER